jgi:hypothetical protein
MITKVQEQIILGSMCGDGSLLNGNRCINYHFSEAHCHKQLPYLKWKIRNLKQFGVHYNEYSMNSKYGKELKYGRFQTNIDKYFTYLRSVFYPNGIRRKIITREVLDKLNTLGLAIWYMDDGYYSYHSKIVSISSCINDYNIQLMFKKYFSEVWGLNTCVRSHIDHDKRVHILYFDVLSSDKFLRMIKRYVVGCLNYKLGHLLKSNENRLIRIRKVAINGQRILRSTEYGKLKIAGYNKKYKERIKQWNLNNKEHRQKYMKEYYQNNKDKWNLR